MSAKFTDVLDVAIVSSPLITRHLIALHTKGSDLIPIPRVGGYGLFMPG
jgi:hypothetical protein